MARRPISPAVTFTLGGAVLAAAVALASCFAPNEPGCAFSCARDGFCPAEYTCQQDGLCHRIDGKGICELGPVDAAAPLDGSSDAGD